MRADRFTLSGRRLCGGFLILLFAATLSAGGRMQIEEAQREYQARYEAKTGERVAWPPCPCNRNTPPAYPKDGFYGDEIENPEFAALLVDDLADKVLDNWGGALSGFVDPGFIGSTNPAPATIPRPDDLRPVTVQNYAEQFTVLVEYLRKLTHITAPALWTGDPGFPDPDRLTQKTLGMFGGLNERTCEILRDEWAAAYETAPWTSPLSAAPTSLAGVQMSIQQDTFMSGFTVIKGRLKTDLTAYARYGGDAQCLVKMEAGPGGYGSAVAPAGMTLTDGWQDYAAATPQAGAVYFSEVLPAAGAGEPPLLSPGCQGGTVVHLEGWTIPDLLVLLEPEFKTEPDSDRSCADLCCQTCDGECLPGTVQAELGSLELYIDLGGTEGASDAGFLYLHADRPAANLASPAALRAAVHDDVELVHEGDALRQVLSEEALADIQVLSPHAYELRFYRPADVGAFSNGVYGLIGTPEPFSITSMENPDGAAASNRLTVTSRLLGGERLYAYTWSEADQTWQLHTGEGADQKRERLAAAWTVPDVLREETYTAYDAGDQIVYRQVDTYQVFPWGEEQVASVVDPDGRALTTTWAYFDDEHADGHEYGRLKQRVDPDGYWEAWHYDPAGRVTRTTTPFLDAAPGSPDASCRVVETTYAPWGEDAERRTESVRVQGVEVARTHVLREAGRETRVDCLRPGEDAGTTHGLVTVRKLSTNPLIYGKPTRVEHPDGTLSLWKYRFLGDTRTTTLSRGTPSADGTKVVKGTKVERTQGPRGHDLLEITTDLGSGRVTGRKEVIETDVYGRPCRTVFLDQTTQSVTYACCGTETETSREGVLTTYVRDALGRALETERQGVTIVREYDVLGRVTNVVRRGSDGSEMSQGRDYYDPAGQLVAEEDGLGRVTTTDETFAGGHRIVTTTYPDGGTEVWEYYRDGQLFEQRGTAVAPMRYRYGVEEVQYDGQPRWFQFTQVIALGEGPGATNEWTKTYVDMLGRTALTVYPDGAREEQHYNDRGQLAKQVDPDGVTTLYTYDDLGRLLDTVLDVNTNGVVDWSGPDRITREERTVVYAGGAVWNRSVQSAWTTTGSSGDVVEVSLHLAKADDPLSLDIAHGLTNRTTVALAPAAAAKTVTRGFPDGSSQVTTYTNGFLRSVARYDAAQGLLREEVYDYDTHGRVARITGPGGPTAYTYDHLDRVVEVTLPPAEAGRVSLTLSNVYDTMGRLTQVIRPEGMVSNEYFLTGALKRTFGAGTYPVDFTYDPQGRLETLTTWADHAAGSGAAVTSWDYDERGRLSAKTYPDATAVGYAYTPAGRLRTRTWARDNVTTTYGHDAAGRLTSVTYSDGTPEVIYRYDRLGRMREVDDGVGTRVFQYNLRGQVTSETFAAGAQSGFQVVHDYDLLARPVRLALEGGAELIHDAGYGYDAASRMNAVSNRHLAIAYQYDAASGLLASTIFTNAGTHILKRDNAYDALSRLLSVSNVAASAASAYRYAYEHLDRRVRMDLADGSHWAYGYDDLGQLVSGVRRQADETPWPGQQFGYVYDDIGNRVGTTDSEGVKVYTADPLNRYEQRTVPGAASMYGQALEAATVTLNDRPVERLGAYFHGLVEADNAYGDAYATGRVVAVVNGVGPQGEDAVMEDARAVFLPQTPEVYTCDADGNLVRDGQWDYTWDAENRLVGVETRADLLSDVPRLRLAFSYDYLGRRTRGQVDRWVTNQWVRVLETIFLYDGWNLLAEIVDTPTPPYSDTNLYTWGLDLSGSIHGAAGVGGLLAVTAQDSTCYATYDGNGNVTGLVDAGTGASVAEYIYDPFGRPLKATGPLAMRNPFRWSTRYTDNLTGLILYPHRAYHPSLGRWLSRDPIGEEGGHNLYAFVANNPVSGLDPLGLALYAIGWERVRDMKHGRMFQSCRSYQGTR